MTAEVDQAPAGIPVPDEFFREILPRTRDLGELKAVLHVIQISSARQSPAVALRDLLEPAILRSVVGLTSPEPAEERLKQSLDRAVVNGSLLRLAVAGQGILFLVATARNRELVRGMRDDLPGATEVLGVPPGAEVTIYRANSFALYEEHIGPLTPLIAEQLRDAERSYPRAWIEEAILTAVHYNKRNWRYIEAILSRWEETGGPDGGYTGRP